MEKINAWVFLGAMLLGFAFAVITIKLMIPAVVAEISSQRQVIEAVNQTNREHATEANTRFTKIEMRLDALEKQR